MEEINQKYNTEYTNRLVEHKAIFHELYDAWGPSWAGNCGGYLFDGRTYVYDHTSYEKQELLYEKAKHATSVLEVGSYVGHSLFIMLLANPTLKITSIDICDEYTGPAIRVLNKHFNNCIRFIHADSIVFDDEISLRGFSSYLQGYRKNVKVELPNCGWSNIYIEFDEPEIKRTF